MGIVLVTDDDGMCRKMAEMMVKKTGNEVVQADSGDAAIAYLKANPVDAMLLDIEMPVKNGIETLAEIRSMEEFKNLPVVIMTGTINDEALEAKETYNAVDCIEKPFKPAIIMAAVNQMFL